MYPSSAQTSPDFPQTFPSLPRLNIGILAFVPDPIAMRLSQIVA